MNMENARKGVFAFSPRAGQKQGRTFRRLTIGVLFGLFVFE